MSEETPELTPEKIEQLAKEEFEPYDEDLGLPEAFVDEALAPYALSHMNQILQGELSARASKAVGNEAQANKLLLEVNASKAILGWLKRNRPQVLELARELAALEAKNIQQSRARLRQEG